MFNVSNFVPRELTNTKKVMNPMTKNILLALVNALLRQDPLPMRPRILAHDFVDVLEIMSPPRKAASERMKLGLVIFLERVCN